MRPLEIIVASLLTFRIVIPLLFRKRWLDWIPILSLVISILHLIIEGYRWQLVPIYALSLGLGIFSIWRLINHKNKEAVLQKGSGIKSLVGLIILGIAVLPGILLPVPQLPEPTGPYKVGTISLMLTDESRQELYSGVTGQPRRLMVQVWYPAEPENGADPALWMEHVDQFGPAMSSYLDFPSYFLDHVEYSKSHAFKDAPLASGDNKFPLLLFSHGWNGFRVQNTYQAEELASHGYVVVAPDHAYGAVVTVFPDGEVALNNPQALPSGMGLPDDQFMAAANLLGQQWSGDLSFILGNLEDEDVGDFSRELTDRLDFERVGAFGHSTGGGAAIQFCAVDSRCKVFFGLDPYLDPVSPLILAEGISQPIMAIFSQVWAERSSDGNDIFANFFQASCADRYHFYIEGTAHFDFTDLPAFSPLAHMLGLKGAINGPRALRIINDYSLAYFNQYLKGENGAFDKTQTYPEVIWKNRITN